MKRGGPTVADVGENALLEALLGALPAPARFAGVGDDCAVIGPATRGRLTLLKTDCVIEGVHFISGTAAHAVGWKALCRPLSDLAAMGGRPAHALVTLALGADTPVAYARGIYAGLGRAAKEFGVRVAGGETALSPGPIFLSVCLMGTVAARACIRRSGGRAGDRLYVTGRLGGSFASGRHLRFRPRLAEGEWLAAHFAPTAMMDLSDGLVADLPRLARASETGFRLDRSSVPRARGCSIDQALGDGEDYELLFAMRPRRALALEAAWRRKFPRLTLTCIGELDGPGTASGLGAATGYEHFTATK
jgi:thiamine-monophosphate kinase